jgi:hypothetical protein
MATISAVVLCLLVGFVYGCFVMRNVCAKMYTLGKLDGETGGLDVLKMWNDNLLNALGGPDQPVDPKLVPFPRRPH